ncbi:MAG: hypothetical protein QMD46_09865 [Methanomicrobiales archaeon]|nr:hypothetical protein [Methanomicrobiales archaeon]MDI6876792.1 hypothetical protein [Methanomicrobiales archaeon]
MPFEEAGTIVPGMRGGVVLRIGPDLYVLGGTEIKTLLFYGSTVSVWKYSAQRTLEGYARIGMQFAGVARTSRSGRAVLFSIGGITYIVPRDDLADVAKRRRDEAPLSRIVPRETRREEHG